MYNHIVPTWLLVSCGEKPALILSIDYFSYKRISACLPRRYLIIPATFTLLHLRYVLPIDQSLHS